MRKTNLAGRIIAALILHCFLMTHVSWAMPISQLRRISVVEDGVGSGNVGVVLGHRAPREKSGLNIQIQECIFQLLQDGDFRGRHGITLEEKLEFERARAAGEDTKGIIDIEKLRMTTDEIRKYLLPGLESLAMTPEELVKAFPDIPSQYIPKGFSTVGFPEAEYLAEARVLREDGQPIFGFVTGHPGYKQEAGWVALNRLAEAERMEASAETSQELKSAFNYARKAGIEIGKVLAGLDAVHEAGELLAAARFRGERGMALEWLSELRDDRDRSEEAQKTLALLDKNAWKVAENFFSELSDSFLRKRDDAAPQKSSEYEYISIMYYELSMECQRRSSEINIKEIIVAEGDIEGGFGSSSSETPEAGRSAEGPSGEDEGVLAQAAEQIILDHAARLWEVGTVMNTFSTHKYWHQVIVEALASDAIELVTPGVESVIEGMGHREIAETILNNIPEITTQPPLLTRAADEIVRNHLAEAQRQRTDMDAFNTSKYWHRVIIKALRDSVIELVTPGIAEMKEKYTAGETINAREIADAIVYSMGAKKLKTAGLGYNGSTEKGIILDCTGLERSEYFRVLIENLDENTPIILLVKNNADAQELINQERAVSVQGHHGSFTDALAKATEILHRRLGNATAPIETVPLKDAAESPEALAGFLYEKLPEVGVTAADKDALRKGLRLIAQAV